MTVSVLIPSHNRVSLLRRTLGSFQQVEIPTGVEVEVIVTANACTDSTLDMLAELTAEDSIPLRYFNEETPGANFARNRCLQEAQGNILAFVDDDIRFDPGWLRGLTEVFENTRAAVVGGRIKLWWEAVEEPKWLTDELAHILSAYDLGDEVQQVGLPGPVGANMAFRRQVYEVLGPMHTGIQDDQNSLNRGDEVEYLHRAGQKGFNGFYAPDALVHHWVSPDRVTPEFFKKAGRGFGHSRVNMKERFGPAEAARSITGYLYLSMRHGIGEVVAKRAGETAEQYYQSYARHVGLGGLQGSWIRLKQEVLG